MSACNAATVQSYLTDQAVIVRTNRPSKTLESSVSSMPVTFDSDALVLLQTDVESLLAFRKVLQAFTEKYPLASYRLEGVRPAGEAAFLMFLVEGPFEEAASKVEWFVENELDALTLGESQRIGVAVAI